MSELVEGGLLNPVQKFSSAKRFKKFRTDEIDALLAKLEEKIVPDPSMPSEDIWKFPLLAQLELGSGGVGLATFVNAVLAGSLLIRGKNGEKGFAGFFFSRQEVLAWSRRQSSESDGLGKLIPIQDVPSYSGLTLDTVYWLVRKGFLPDKRRVRRLGIVVAKGDLDYFLAHHVLGAKLANESGTRIGFIRRCLSKLGIEPVASRTIGNRAETLYRKADVEGVDLRAIVVATIRESRRVRQWKQRRNPSSG